MKPTSYINFLLAATVCFFVSCQPKQTALSDGDTLTLSVADFKDKIKGGWAGQTIGCTYGGPTEFKYRGALIHDDTPIIWYDDYARETFELDPGLYDDVYMDLTFVEVMARCGIDAPADSFALSFANAPYKLWHANQAARYNILNGIMPPASGHWKNNPHADDIDFQIEADFAGMMTPGMVNTGVELCDKIGHIMNSGDGYYGGVYMSAMYSLAFVSNDLSYIVTEALKTIPARSKYRQCIEEVIRLHKKYPSDWKRCWYEMELKYAQEIGCPEGVFNAFNIDAALNSAYVVIGLLYGDGDFYKTMDISTRCGQDSDCNPASACGILGVMMGYKNIPEKWKPAMEKVEDLDFPYTTISLNRIYDLNYDMALELITRHGGAVNDSTISVKFQAPKEVAWEENFVGHFPSERRVIGKPFEKDSLHIDFTGNGIVVMGFVKQVMPDNLYYVANMEAYIDGQLVESFKMPFDYIKRKYDIFHRYDLPQGNHTLVVKWVNPHPNYAIQTKDVVIYANQARVVTK